MKRLTHWNYKNTTLALDSCKPYLKLGQLEDLEEELGIDLLTLFKALKNGVYHKNENNIIEFDNDIEFNYGYYADESTPKTYYFTGDEMYLFSDYGKSWSLDKNDLTKEEIEDDR